MTKNRAHKMLNPILAVLILNQAVTAALHDFLPDEVFEVLHGGGGALLAVGVLLHVILNWSWVRATLLKPRAAAAP